MSHAYKTQCRHTAEPLALSLDLILVYDEAGHLIGEYNALGQAIEETFYLGDMPIAVLMAGKMYFVYADQVNAPRVLVGTDNNPVWDWEGEPFEGQRLDLGRARRDGQAQP